ncbi:MAG: proton-conducting membrane transporter [Lachnospiraceae bacterium]|nr:proton-conducting membrane transporter [Lachnospiraceae bacterium]
MPTFLIAFPVFFPIFAGALLIAFPGMKRRTRNICTFTVSIINLVVVMLLIINGMTMDMEMIRFTSQLVFAFRIDGLGKFFAILVSVLWPFSLLYSYEYMEDDSRQGTFYTFFMMTLGAVLGIAFARDFFSMYVFYEILSLVTFPLVMHEMSPEAVKAGWHYLVYMLGGAAFAFIGMVIILIYGDTLTFTYGGVLGQAASGNESMLVFVFFITFMGLGVKAAIMPFGKWLIEAAVAPMPVTGLLHAVAVVKAGAFAIIRLIYYVYGADFLKGSWAQYLCMAVCAFTILYGSTMAVKELHLKRRLAYSTISNLSYVVFGAVLMSPAGMTGSLTHLVMHAVAKIGLFFSIGALMHTNHKVYQYEIDGIGKKMKWTFAAFTLCGMSLIGIPQFGGFISKFRLLDAVIDDGGIPAYIGGMCLIISALLTAVYLLTTVQKAYFPADGHLCDGYDKVRDPGWKMLVPIWFSVIMSVVLGLAWQPLVDFIKWGIL